MRCAAGCAAEPNGEASQGRLGCFALKGVCFLEPSMNCFHPPWSGFAGAGAQAEAEDRCRVGRAAAHRWVLAAASGWCAAACMPPCPVQRWTRGGTAAARKCSVQLDCSAHAVLLLESCPAAHVFCGVQAQTRRCISHPSALQCARCRASRRRSCCATQQSPAGRCSIATTSGAAARVREPALVADTAADGAVVSRATGGALEGCIAG